MSRYSNWKMEKALGLEMRRAGGCGFVDGASKRRMAACSRFYKEKNRGDCAIKKEKCDEKRMGVLGYWRGYWWGNWQGYLYGRHLCGMADGRAGWAASPGNDAERPGG